MRQRDDAEKFGTETELCAAFIEWFARFPGWVAYPETHGWDILLAHVDGTQIGVQAKLKFNMKVLSQTIAGWRDWHGTGPDFRSILVPTETGPDQELCSALGIGVFTARKFAPTDRHPQRFEFEPDLDSRYSTYRTWHYANPEKRHELPRYVPDVAAGASAPTSLTRWKIAALEIAAILELRGYVTRNDFKLAGIDHRRWTELWLEPDLKSGAWRANAKMPNFAAQHPVVYPQVLADMRGKVTTADGLLTC